MAAMSLDEAASPDNGLGDDDLGDLHRALYPVRNKYKSLGLQIGVRIGEIECIESIYTDPGDRLLGILSVRVKKAEPLTWNDIDTALRLDCVGEGRTARDIQKKYGHLFMPEETQITSSRTPESSPELKQNHSQVEVNTNIFERHFGQLCCSMVNPVEIAAQLQKKGVIPKSLMKDMIMSPESRQAKAICLCDKVEEKIKSKPDSLFVLIEVLLENEGLRKTGTEMLREAGKLIITAKL